jgi:hypothetical protein
MRDRIKQWFEEAGCECQFCWKYKWDYSIPGDPTSEPVITPLEGKVPSNMIFFATNENYETVSKICTRKEYHCPVLFSLPYYTLEEGFLYGDKFRQLCILNDTHVIKVGW